MKLTERHIISRNNVVFDTLLDLLHKSNNLYNRGMFVVRQHYLRLSGKNFTEDISDSPKDFLSYYDVDRLLKTTNDKDYRSLPNNISQEVLQQLNRDWKSFFGLLKLKKSRAYTQPVKIPSYKKSGGSFMVVLNTCKLSKVDDSTIRLPKTKVEITGLQHLKTSTQIRIIPCGDHFVIEEIYEKEAKSKRDDNGRYASIDLGISNLATVSSNVTNSFIINGKPLKSINQYYNKKKSHLQEELMRVNGVHSSKKLRKLTLKRNNKIDWFMHNASKYIVNQLVSNNINTLIIGKNDGWKQEINVGKKNNQNFVSIPHSKFISLLKYKCEFEGINVVLQEESYTSKVSFIDNDYIPTYGADDEKFNPSGSRVRRGLYKTKNHQYLNADINGSLNILRKYLNVASDEIIPVGSRGLVVRPFKVNL